MSDPETTATTAVTSMTTADANAVAGHVLLADANDRTRESRFAQLCRSGYHVTLSRTSFETIVKACCHLPDVIVLDDSLGPAEVEETTRLLATCPATAHLRVLRVGSGRRLPLRALSRAQPVAI